MNLPESLLGEAWYWASWVVWLTLFARSLFRAPWSTLKDSERLNVWFGMVVLLTLVWQLKAGVRPGLSLHLLGATVFSLCFGRHLAFVGLSLVQAGIVINGDGDVFSFALNVLLLAGVGVALSQAVYGLASRYLPHNFFVYVFVNGFFGAALALLGVGVAACLVLALGGAYESDYLVAEYLPYFLLLGFSEAWLSGMLMTLFVIYRPDWVVTFDDSSYLVNK